MTTEQNDSACESAGEHPKPAPKCRTIKAEDIFKGSREIWLEHDGARYCLRITRRNNLILHK
jgi:hemin uptake protein HemP